MTWRPLTHRRAARAALASAQRAELVRLRAARSALLALCEASRTRPLLGTLTAAEVKDALGIPEQTG
jgi:hypothetical protein